MERIPTPGDVAARQTEVARKSTAQEAFERAERLDVDLWAYEITPEVAERSLVDVDVWQLQPYIGIKGGAARNFLAAAIDPTATLYEPRDVDLVVLQDVVEAVGYDARKVDAVARSLHQHFSPRDAEYSSYGPDVISQTEEHMTGADFTVNQVLVRRERGTWYVGATAQAIIDTAEHVIRPTTLEHDVETGHLLGNKLALKAVRLLSEMQVAGVKDARIEGIHLNNKRELYGDPRDDYFMQVLQLDKALEWGYDVALKYLFNLEELGMLPEGMSQSNDVATLYRELTRRADFEPSAGVPEILRKIESAQEMGIIAVGRQTPDGSGVFEGLYRRQVVMDNFTGRRPR